MNNILAKMALALIRFYQQYISPLSPPSCRFYPTCSHYAKEAIERHGFWYGGWLAMKRIIKCQPLHPGGVDLVPDKKPSLCKILRKC